jgi:hypothetical protein
MMRMSMPSKDKDLAVLVWPDYAGELKPLQRDDNERRQDQTREVLRTNPLSVRDSLVLSPC